MSGLHTFRTLTRKQPALNEMAKPTEVSIDPPSPHPPPYVTGDFDPCIHKAPLDDPFFAMIGGDATPNDESNTGYDVLEGLDFDFSFDDLCPPISDDLCPPISDDLDDLFEQTLKPMQQSDSQSGSDLNIPLFSMNFDQFHSVFKSASRELTHLPGGVDFPGDQSLECSGVLSSSPTEMESHQISVYLNIPSPESNGSNRDSTEICGGDADEKVLKCNLSESEGSGNFVSNVSEDNRRTRSVSSSPNSSNSSIRTGVVDQKIKLEEPANNSGTTLSLKRKNSGEHLANNNIESRTNKYRKSDCSVENTNTSGNINEGLCEEEDKKKTRLLRNRESAQLSRQRKKHYVEELEDKVRSMHSTIQDLNAKITYFMAENATLRQQMGGGGAGSTAPSVPGAPPPPPPVAPPPHAGVYPPHLAMMYPWMPCPPPYMVKQQGSQVPLIPIPRLKTKQPAQPPKTSKKAFSKRNEGPKTKKVASISFLGLLFFIMLFGGLVPTFNVRYGGIRKAFTGGDGHIRDGFVENHHGRVLMVNGTECGERHDSFIDPSGQRVQPSWVDPDADEGARLGNGSEPLAASLYVPRNDKLVKIDGNLIIHSVLATEKAMASHGKQGNETTGLVVPRDLAPTRPAHGVGIHGARHHSHLRALGSGSGDNDGKSTTTDGSLQQWFREGLAGPMLSSGLCSEVFQFDVSAPGAIIPAAPTTTNITEIQTPNSTNPNKARNRRILHPVHFPKPSPHHISSDQPHAGGNPEKENLDGSKNASSMVVSVLFDPREAGDADADGVIGAKSLSRIFVVVLIDSIKYVTYSCMLPFSGSGTHLVAA